MAKVKGPLFSIEAWGSIGKAIIYRKGGVASRYFIPRDPKTPAQLAQREAFLEFVMSGLTKEEADLLYAAILHGHTHGDAEGLDVDDHEQYHNDARGDARYVGINDIGRSYLPMLIYVGQSPFSSNGFPYAAPIDREISLVSWKTSYKVATTNNGSHYWTIRLTLRGGAVFPASYTTVGGGVDVWVNPVITTFSPSELDETDEAIYIEVIKTGSPGNLVLAGSLLEIVG